MKTELAGYVGVDTGQVMIVDPVYVKYWGGDDLSPNWRKKRSTRRFDYEGACIASTSKKMYGQLMFAVVASAGYGDGEYPVYITRDEHGRIASMTVDFLSTDDLEDD